MRPIQPTQRTILALVLFICACGGRPIAGSSDGGATMAKSPPTDASGADAALADPRGADWCPYPEGTCDFDAQCPDGHCVGAMHTTDIPHVFACRGVCRSEWCDAFSRAPLVIRLSREDGLVVARVANTGCEPIYLQRPCGTRGPLVSIRPSAVNDETGNRAPCGGVDAIYPCTAEPSCEVIQPNGTQEVPFPDLDACFCEYGTRSSFQAVLEYFADGPCSGTALLAVSNDLVPSVCAD